MPKSYKLQFAHQEVLLDAAGSLFLPSSKTLIVSDLHLGKGSFLAQLGNPLPLYDTFDTLLRLENLLKIYNPEQVICLGDNMHDADAVKRMVSNDKTYLEYLYNSITSWHWILGNHDKLQLPLPQHTYFLFQYEIDGITFSHHLNNDAEFQIIGHYHPCCSINIRSEQIRGKCFVMNKNIIIMPAFGTYTGGLDVKHEVFDTIFKKEVPSCYLIYKKNIRRVS